jgi:hypothetical protein
MSMSVIKRLIFWPYIRSSDFAEYSWPTVDSEASIQKLSWLLHSNNDSTEISICLNVWLSTFKVSAPTKFSGSPAEQLQVMTERWYSRVPFTFFQIFWPHIHYLVLQNNCSRQWGQKLAFRTLLFHPDSNRLTATDAPALVSRRSYAVLRRSLQR